MNDPTPTDVTHYAPIPAVTVFNADLNRELIELAKMVAPGTLLPATYRNQPANLLIAFNLGVELGISPMQALYDIYVVNGRPSMSANLMAALVRRAGHKLHVTGDDKACTATLTRSDMPDDPFAFTWTIEMARNAQLAGKDTWKFYPATMLRCRAISEACKAGASECLKGITLSTEEARDMVVEGELVEPAKRRGGMDAVRAAVADAKEPAGVDVVTGEVTDDQPRQYHVAGRAVDLPAPDPEPTVVLITDEQRKQITAMWADAGITSNPRSNDGQAERLEFIETVIGERPASIRDVTSEQADQIIDALAATADMLAAQGEPELSDGQ